MVSRVCWAATLHHKGNEGSHRLGDRAKWGGISVNEGRVCRISLLPPLPFLSTFARELGEFGTEDPAGGRVLFCRYSDVSLAEAAAPLQPLRSESKAQPKTKTKGQLKFAT